LKIRPTILAGRIPVLRKHFLYFDQAPVAFFFKFTELTLTGLFITALNDPRLQCLG
jgi:hypothetical protein